MRELPLCQGQVFLFQPAVEQGRNILIFGDYGQASGILIQTVHLPEGNGQLSFQAVVGKDICQGVLTMALGGMAGHGGGFVIDQEVRVVINDFHRQINGRFAARFILQLQPKNISGGKLIDGADMLPIAEQPGGGFFQFCQHAA